MRYLALMPAVALALAVTGCDKADNGDGGLAETPGRAYSLFDPVAASAVIPFPNDGLFTGTTDGTLNIPNPTNAPFVVAANELDGFSTVASGFADFIGQVDAASANQPGAFIIINTRTFATLVPGVDYRIVETQATDPVTGVPIGELRTRLLIEPLKPLAPATTYLVVVTRALRSDDGVPVEPADLFRAVLSEQSIDTQLVAGTEPALRLLSAAQRANLEGIRQLYQTRILPPLAAAGIARQNIVIAWPFTTQTVGATLAYLQANAAPGGLILVSTGLNLNQLNAQLPPVADVYVGSLALPYYLADASPVTGAEVHALNSFWLADAAVVASGSSTTGVPCAGLAQAGAVSRSTTGCFPAPQQRSTQRVPVLVTLPNANSGQSMPANGWPVVVFQHGITSDRTAALGLAPALSLAGFAVVSIDLPLHGLPPGNPLRAATEQFPEPLRPRERTFDLDLVDNQTGAAGPDGTVDGSGTHFINLSSLLTSRDNLRQGEADLMTVTASLGSAVILGGTFQPNGMRFDGNTVRFVGHSLGGIVGTPFLAQNQVVGAATLGMPGGGIAKLLDGSASFGPRIAAGLQASSGGAIAEGNDNYETFLRFAQTAVDDGDPINYALVAAQRHPVHMIAVRGDAVVPNCVIAGDPNCPATDRIVNSGFLSGTDPLARIMGLDYVPGPGPTDGLDVPAAPQIITGPDARNVVVRFNQGDHGSILRPEPGADGALAVLCEMQGQTATFLATNGGVLRIGNPCPGAN